MDSTLNQDSTGGTSLAIDVAREVKISAATVAASCSPVSTDYNLLFRGDIDEWDAGENPMRLSARDPGGLLMDRWIESTQTYGTSSGTAIEVVMQEILDDALGSTDIALTSSASPGFLITPYNQRREPIQNALQTLADLIGYMVRYRWSTASGDFTLQLYPPGRSNTTPHSTFTASRYESFPRLSVNRENIRNAVAVRYPSSVTEQEEVVTVESSCSIAHYGRQWMSITEPGDSAIDTSSEASVFATAALNDLSEPDVEQGVGMHFYWPVEINDLYNWEANDVHYDAAQSLAVVSWEHDLSKDRHRTSMELRGKARSAIKDWIDKGDPIKLLNFRSLIGKVIGEGMFLPSSDNVDGYVVNYFGASSATTWANIHDGDTGAAFLLAADDTGTTLACGGAAYSTLSGSDETWGNIGRAAMLFNTGGTVPRNSIILGGSVSVYTDATDAAAQEFGTGASVVICGCSLTDNTNMVSTTPPLGFIADYTGFGTVDYSNRVLLADIPGTVDTEVPFYLNAAGLAAISRDGISSLGMRWSADIDDSPPARPSSGGSIGFDYWSAENGSSNLSPKLALVYL